MYFVCNFFYIFTIYILLFAVQVYAVGPDDKENNGSSTNRSENHLPRPRMNQVFSLIETPATPPQEATIFTPGNRDPLRRRASDSQVNYSIGMSEERGSEFQLGYDAHLYKNISKSNSETILQRRRYSESNISSNRSERSGSSWSDEVDGLVFQMARRNIVLAVESDVPSLNPMHRSWCGEFREFTRYLVNAGIGAISGALGGVASGSLIGTVGGAVQTAMQIQGNATASAIASGAGEWALTSMQSGALTGVLTGVSLGALCANDPFPLTSHAPFMLATSSTAALVINAMFPSIPGFIAAQCVSFGLSKLVAFSCGESVANLPLLPRDGDDAHWWGNNLEENIDVRPEKRTMVRNAMTAVSVGAPIGALIGGISGIGAAAGISSLLDHNESALRGIFRAILQGALSGTISAHGNPRATFLVKIKASAASAAPVGSGSAAEVLVRGKIGDWGAKVVLIVSASTLATGAGVAIAFREALICMAHQGNARLDEEAPSGLFTEDVMLTAVRALPEPGSSTQDDDDEPGPSSSSSGGSSMRIVQATTSSYVAGSSDEEPHQDKGGHSGGEQAPLPESAALVQTDSVFLNMPEDENDTGDGTILLVVVVQDTEEPIPPVEEQHESGQDDPIEEEGDDEFHDASEEQPEEEEDMALYATPSGSMDPLNEGPEGDWNYDSQLASLELLDETITSFALTEDEDTDLEDQASEYDPFLAKMYNSPFIADFIETNKITTFASLNAPKRCYEHSLDKKISKAGISLQPFSSLMIGLSYKQDSTLGSGGFKSHNGYDIGGLRNRGNFNGLTSFVGWNSTDSGWTFFVVGKQGWLDLKNTRTFAHRDTYVDSKGNAHLNFQSFKSSIGYRINFIETISLTPYISSTTISIRQNAYTEKNAFIPIEIGKISQKLFVTSLGIKHSWKVSEAISIQSWASAKYYQKPEAVLSLSPYDTKNGAYVTQHISKKQASLHKEFGISSNICITDNLFLKGVWRHHSNIQDSNIHTVNLSISYTF